MMPKAKMDTMMRKIHGGYDGSVMMAHQGASAFLGAKSQFPAQNPLTKSGKRVLENMQEQYGAEKGKGVFYASIKMKKKGSSKWHK